MPYRAIAYVSTAAGGLHTEDIDRLLVDARAHNQLAGVTGVLLYDGSRFFQYFEGPDQGVARIYARIQASRMHVQLEELFDENIEMTFFTQWHMGCTKTEGSTLQKYSTGQWHREANFLLQGPHTGAPEILQDLVKFWEAASLRQ